MEYCNNNLDCEPSAYEGILNDNFDINKLDEIPEIEDTQ